ncbi:MAG TPA: hypothetical protein VGE41_07810 [Verrucomicrobiae bacterium]|jgi:hypothetical protein
MRKYLITLVLQSLLFIPSFQVAAADAPATFTVGEFKFTRPEKWEWIESTSAMRKAQLKVGKGTESAEVVFYYFGQGGGGGTKANVDRWLSQFQDAKNQKTEEVTVNKHKVTYVQVEGTYLSGMPGTAKTPMSNSMLQGAILESDEGSVFVKMTGPIELVKENKQTFRKMVEGALK